MGKVNEEFTHLDENGKAKMVDVSAKTKVARTAVARIIVAFERAAFKKISEEGVAKGDIFAVARIAGIMAAKKTAELIPLCHPIFLSCCEVKFVPKKDENKILIYTRARAVETTGVEMEAIVAAQAAAAAVYDMCKAVSKKIRIDRCELVFKSGGKSGPFKNDDIFDEAVKDAGDWLAQ